MGKGRLEAFSDGVFAIIITIMVLELKAPHTGEIAGLLELWPVFLAYVLSFIYVGIYWNNHHHLLHATRGITGGALWANLHLLFWLSLVPFATNWVGECQVGHPATPWPAVIYGAVLALSGAAFAILTAVLVRSNGKDSPLALAVKSDLKAKGSVAVYLVAMGLAFVRPWIAYALYVAVAFVWLVPDRRIEKSA